MKQKIAIEIDCGETTCIDLKDVRHQCKYFRDVYCALYDKPVHWDRLPECLAAKT